MAAAGVRKGVLQTVSGEIGSVWSGFEVICSGNKVASKNTGNYVTSVECFALLCL